MSFPTIFSPNSLLSRGTVSPTVLVLNSPYDKVHSRQDPLHTSLKKSYPGPWTIMLTVLTTALSVWRLGTLKGFPGSSEGKESACSARDRVRSLGPKDPLEKGMATHSSIIA